MNKKLLVFALLFVLLLLSGCSIPVAQQPAQTACDDCFTDISEDDNIMDIEATILSLTKEGLTTPDDKAKIKIDKVYYYSKDSSWNPPEVGDEIEVEFKYSARPAMIQHFVTTPPKSLVKKDGRLGITEIKKEDDMFIYKVAVWHETEDITLPGVEEGDKISFGALYSLNYVTKEMKIIIPEYKVLNINKNER